MKETLRKDVEIILIRFKTARGMNDYIFRIKQIPKNLQIKNEKLCICMCYRLRKSFRYNVEGNELGSVMYSKI